MKRSKTNPTAAGVVPCGRIVQGVDVDREWRIFGEIVPSTTEYDHRRRRTAYFYRKQAIAWLRSALRFGLGDLTAAECKATALRYLAHYKAAKAATGGAL